MIKKIIRNILEKFGYTINKKYKNEHEDALFHNSLENINFKNNDLFHFKNNIKNDSYFIDCIYPYIKKIFKNKEINFLDVGCGSGVLVNKLIEDKIGINIKGCDFSEIKIKQCNKYYKYNVYFTHNILNPINKNFDLITCTEVLEHLEYPELALYNLLKALKDGGNLIITVPDGRKDTYIGHINFWSQESFKLFIIRETLYHKKDFDLEFKLICDKNYVRIKKG
jgi:2-polyprenyl-3-methyl-5-hydroxy-6-metoxy-1,4-benzoquinol methylase